MLSSVAAVILGIGAVGLARQLSIPESADSSTEPGDGTVVNAAENEELTDRRRSGRNWERVTEVVATLDAPVDYRDSESARDGYDPARGEVFRATDTGTVSIGSGDGWQTLPAGDGGTLEGLTVSSGTDRTLVVDPGEGYQGLVDALDELGDRPGTVVVESGRIDDIDGNVTIPSHTHLRGMGAGETTLAFGDDVDMDLAGLLRIEGEDVVISDLTLDGNRANVSLGSENLGQEYAVYTSGARQVVITRVYCHDFPGYGFDPHADGTEPSRNISVVDCVARNNGLDGVTFAGVVDGFVANTLSVGNDRHGLAVTDPEGDGVTFVNNVAVGNGACGAVVQNASETVTVRASLLAANDTDGVRVGNSSSTVEDIRLANTLVRDNSRYGVNVRVSRGVDIVDNDVRTNNRAGDADAEIALTASEGTARSVRIENNEISARDRTEFGVLERPGNGPTTVVDNDISVATDAVRLTHSESESDEIEDE